MRIIALTGGSRTDREQFSRMFSAEALRHDRTFMVLAIDELVKNAMSNVVQIAEGKYPDLRNRTEIDQVRMTTAIANPVLWAELIGDTINRYIFRGYNNFIVTDVWTPIELKLLVDKYGADYFTIMNSSHSVDGHGPLVLPTTEPVAKLQWNTFMDIYEDMHDLVDEYFDKYVLECEDKMEEPEELEDIEDESIPYHG